MNHQIPFNKSRYTIAIALSIVITVLGLLMFLQPENFGAELLGHARAEQIGLSLALIFFILLVFVIVKLSGSKMGLVINEDGIEDFAGGLSIGLVKWGNITAFSTKKHVGNTFILVHVNNEDEILQSLGKVKRRLLKENMATFKTPVAISSTMLKPSATEIVQLFKDVATTKGIEFQD